MAMSGHGPYTAHTNRTQYQWSASGIALDTFMNKFRVTSLDSLFINVSFPCTLKGKYSIWLTSIKYMVSSILGQYSVYIRDETKALVVHVLEMREPDVEDKFSHIYEFVGVRRDRHCTCFRQNMWECSIFLKSAGVIGDHNSLPYNALAMTTACRL